MNTKLERFLTCIKRERTRKIFAFIIYVYYILMPMEIELPSAVEFVIGIVVSFIFLFGAIIYITEWMDKMYEKNKGKLEQRINKELKKVGKEILMFIPILLISKIIVYFVMVGQPVNQTNVEKLFYEAPIFMSIFTIIIGPIIEEFIFRFLPYKFIKNKAVYIVVSTIVFAAMHVIDDTNPFYCIWFYMMRPLYYGYRYHKTKNILVPLSMHSLNNMVEVLKLVFP